MSKVWTFFLLKPDVIKRNLVESIEKIIENNFTILKRGCLFLTKDDINLLYCRYTFSEFPKKYLLKLKNDYMRYLSSGMCKYYEVELSNISTEIFTYAKSIQGVDYFPERCAADSIRFKFRDNSKEIKIIEHIDGFGDIPDGIVENLTHTPKDTAERNLQARILRKKLGEKLPPTFND